jgi:hypothetical protein
VFKLAKRTLEASESHDVVRRHSVRPITTRTLALLAVGEDSATITGGYFFHQRPHETHPAVGDAALGARLVDSCAEISNEPLAARR